jgi:histone demethylase JARID1
MDLEMLLKEGESFNVRVEEVDWLKNRIVVRELASKLRDMISAKKHNLTEIEDAVKRGNEFLDSDDKEVAPDEETLLTQCEAHIEAAKEVALTCRGTSQDVGFEGHAHAR